MNYYCKQLQALKKKGFEPQVIYDVEPFKENWADQTQKIFPKSTFFLFESDKNNDLFLKNKKFHCFKGDISHMDSTVKENDIAFPDLIKINTKGCDNSIIKGAKNIVCHADVVILKLKMLEYNEHSTNIHEILDLMHSLGHQISDILEHDYPPYSEENEISILWIKNTSSLVTF